MSEEAIDVFNHILPPAFFVAVDRLASQPLPMLQRAREIRVMVDVEERLRMMERFPGYRQILSLVSPTVEALAGPENSPELARIGNDAQADLVEKYPHAFVGYLASLPMNNTESAVAEADRAMQQRHASGIQLYTNVNGRPLDEPATLAVIEHLASRGYPLWLHPIRPRTFPDYLVEKDSRYDLWWAFGWPYETSVAMCRLAFAGIFDRWPNLIIVTHHVGGLVPMMDGRIEFGLDVDAKRNPPESVRMNLREKPIDALRRFHADTASFGSRATLECGRAFFGIERLLFATDMPFDPEEGPGFIRLILQVLSDMDLTTEERRAILSGNARRLFKIRP